MYFLRNCKFHAVKEEIETLIKYGEAVAERDSRVVNEGREDENLASTKSNTGIPACDPVCDSDPNPNPNPDSDPDPDPDEVHITQRNLPHWTKAGSIYWITFRLADSLSREKLDTWKAERDQWVKRHPEPWSDVEWKEYNALFGERMESWLDAGYGSCALAKPEIRRIVQECLLRFDGQRLWLHAGVIMPNHVHLLLEPLAGNSLPELLKGIKGASARKVNQLLGTASKKFWMEESYDHIVRTEAQYQHFLRYISENSAKADLDESKYWLYVPQTFLSVIPNPQTRMSVLQSAINSTGLTPEEIAIVEEKG